MWCSGRLAHPPAEVAELEALGGGTAVDAPPDARLDDAILFEQPVQCAGNWSPLGPKITRVHLASSGRTPASTTSA